LHQLANEEVTKAEVMRATAEKNIVKHTSGVEANSAALGEVEKELEELKDQLDEVAQYLEDLKEKVEAAQAAQESSKDDLDELKQQLQEKREEIDEFRKKEVGLSYCAAYSSTHKLCSLRLPRSLTSRRKSLLRMNSHLITGGRNTTTLSFMTLSESVYYFTLFLLRETYSDDDEDEDEGADQGTEASSSGEVAVKQEVKREAAEPGHPKKARQHTSSNELYIYSAEELARFKKREMVADSEYLDGISFSLCGTTATD
jgi:structural maintenance of chromosome 4